MGEEWKGGDAPGNAGAADLGGPLQHGEDRVRLLLDAVQDYAICMLDRDGLVTTWNSGAARLNGYATTEILGRDFSTFYMPEDRERGRPQEELRLALELGRYETEGFRVRKDGTRFWSNCVITPVYDETRRHVGFAKITRDFSERRQAEERLRQSEERFRLMVQSVREYAIFTLDRDGFVTSWNPGAERIKGYRAEEILGRHFSTFYTDEARRIHHPENELRIAVATGSYSEEGWRLRKNGDRFWASVHISTLRDAHGIHIGFAKVTRDLTERQKSDELLRQSEERLRLLVESVKDYAIFMLEPDGRVATWNTGAQNIKQYTAKEIIGQHFSVFYPPEGRAAGLPARELEIARRDGRYEERGWRLRKNGERFWANVVLTAVHDGKGELRGFAKITRDMTEQRRIEQEAREAEMKAAREAARAVEAQIAVKLREDFISIAAHELRTPLTALQLKLQGIDLLAKADAAPFAVKLGERMEGAHRQVQRLAGLVERLLDVSRIAGGKLELTPDQADLVAIVGQAIEDFREPAAKAGCALHLEAPPSAAGIWDGARLEQVLVNLLSNAIKYGAGKPIDVRVEELGPTVAVTVTDRGIGIAEHDLARIFARFERAVSVRHYSGLGLGLYITKYIVEAHGGTIRVTSRVGEGSTFRVDLPRRAAPQHGRAQSVREPRQ